MFTRNVPVTTLGSSRASPAPVLRETPLTDEKWEEFIKVKINRPLLDVLKENPAHAKSLKELSTQNRDNKLPKQFELPANVHAALLGT